MGDVPPEVRSMIMSRIRGKDTGPEIVLGQALSRLGLRYRKYYRLGRKTIDIAFVKKRLAVFVDGCFWHGCPICYKPPKSNKGYWAAKMKRNRIRDKKTNKELEANGWIVIRVWEHDVRSNANELARVIQKKLSSHSLHP